MKTERNNEDVFDFGGTIEELKARCKADTSIDPPKTPIFQKWMGQSKPPEIAQAAE